MSVENTRNLDIWTLWILQRFYILYIKISNLTIEKVYVTFCGYQKKVVI